ncbi:MAG: DUF6880 family protein [Steroidobacteraceae bacterium]
MTERRKNVKLITRASLASLAGEKSFARGVGYFETGAVVDLVQTRNAISARVLGSEEYRVVLRLDRADLAWSCTCPLGEEGTFCKHAVATGLAWLEGPGQVRDDLAEIHAHLQSESRKSLVDILVEQATYDPELRARLEAAALRRGMPQNLRSMKDAVNRAFAVRGFVDYRNMRAFNTRAESVVHLLREMRRSGRAKEAAELAGYAMRRGIGAYGKTDDSGGGFGETLRRLADLHLEICRAAKPEPVAFASALFDLQMRDEWSFFKFADYAPLLGTDGLARYRALADAAWKKVPTRAPSTGRDAGIEHYHITAIMEALAQYTGDVDALVAVGSRDLSHPYHFLRNAEILARADREDEALTWAERGMKAFPNDFDPRLVEFLVEAYHKTRRHDDALALAWEHFIQHPGLEAYRHLEKSAGRAKTWKSWREKALTHLRASLKRASRASGARGTGAGHTLLVEIFLHEGDNDAALAEAKAGGCVREVWMHLARAREHEHPQDAADVYRKFIDDIADRRNNPAYDEAATLAGKIKELMQRANQKEEFAEWLEALRTRHRAKRNFMQRIEGM